MDFDEYKNARDEAERFRSRVQNTMKDDRIDVILEEIAVQLMFLNAATEHVGNAAERIGDNVT